MHTFYNLCLSLSSKCLLASKSITSKDLPILYSCKTLLKQPKKCDGHQKSASAPLQHSNKVATKSPMENFVRNAIFVWSHTVKEQASSETFATLWQNEPSAQFFHRIHHHLIHRACFQEVNNNLALSSTINHILILQRLKLMRYCCLVDIQKHGQIIHTKFTK